MGLALRRFLGKAPFALASHVGLFGLVSTRSTLERGLIGSRVCWTSLERENLGYRGNDLGGFLSLSLGVFLEISLEFCFKVDWGALYSVTISIHEANLPNLPTEPRDRRARIALGGQN